MKGPGRDSSLLLLAVALALVGWATLLGLSYTDRLFGQSVSAPRYEND